MTKFTIEAIKQANHELGHHFFEPTTLRFFGSRIGRTAYPKPDGTTLFVTSEQREYYTPRRYTVRRSLEDGSVESVSEFQQFTSAAQARTFARNWQPEDAA